MEAIVDATTSSDQPFKLTVIPTELYADAGVQAYLEQYSDKIRAIYDQCMKNISYGYQGELSPCYVIPSFIVTLICKQVEVDIGSRTSIWKVTCFEGKDEDGYENRITIRTKTYVELMRELRKPEKL